MKMMVLSLLMMCIGLIGLPKALAQNVGLEIKAIERVGGSADAFVERYGRIKLAVKSATNESVQEATLVEKILQSARELFAPSGQSALITIETKAGGLTVPAQRAYYSFRSGDQVDQEELSNDSPITPFVNLAQGFDFLATIKLASSDKLDASLASDLLGVLATAATFVTNPSALLSKLTAPQMDVAAKTVDMRLNAFFSKDRTRSNTQAFHPFMHERIDVAVKTVGSKNPMNLVSLVFETRESILSPSGRRDGYPKPDDIKGRKIGLDSRDTIQGVLEADKELFAFYLSGKPEDLQKFCAGFPARLTQAGLNLYDRSAAMATYLRATDWNKKYQFRPSAGKVDRCVDALDGLAQTNLAVEIKELDHLRKEDPAVRKQFIGDLNKQGTGLWRVLPIVTNERKPDRWENEVLAQEVEVSVQKTSIKLTEKLTLNPGKAQYFLGNDLAEVLSRAGIEYKKSSDGSCFRLYDGSAGKTFYADDFCFLVKDFSLAEPRYTKIDFTVDDSFKVTAIKFLQ